jgi:hypothetical protein
MESAALQVKADKLLASKKAEAELALQTRNNATRIKCTFKEKQLSHAKAMDLKAHERQMSIGEAKDKRGLLKLQFGVLKELTANHEKEEEKEVERIVSLRENNTWDGLSDQHKEKLMIREPAPTMQTARGLVNMQLSSYNVTRARHDAGVTRARHDTGMMRARCHHGRGRAR